MKNFRMGAAALALVSTGLALGATAKGGDPAYGRWGATPDEVKSAVAKAGGAPSQLAVEEVVKYTIPGLDGPNSVPQFKAATFYGPVRAQVYYGFTYDGLQTLAIVPAEANQCDAFEQQLARDFGKPNAVYQNGAWGQTLNWPGRHNPTTFIRDVTGCELLVSRPGRV